MSRDAKEVICPFYKDETERAIRCEGYISDTCTNTFKGNGEKKEYKHKYCNRNYEDCEHSKKVMSKYE